MSRKLRYWYDDSDLGPEWRLAGRMGQRLELLDWWFPPGGGDPIAEIRFEDGTEDRGWAGCVWYAWICGKCGTRNKAHLVTNYPLCAACDTKAQPEWVENDHDD